MLQRLAPPIGKCFAILVIFVLLTADDIQQKLRNLRTSYTRERRKVETSERSGAGVDTVFRSCWPYFEALDAFLRPEVAMRESVTNLVRNQDVILIIH